MCNKLKNLSNNKRFDIKLTHYSTTVVLDLLNQATIYRTPIYHDYLFYMYRLFPQINGT